MLRDDVPLVEWPTLLVMLATYGALMLGTTSVWTLWPPLGLALTTVAIAQYSSLQHEVLHGHPFRSRWASEAVVLAAVTLFIPYIRFKDLHLAHHHDPILTDPYDDPESNYLDPKVWHSLPAWQQQARRFNNTLLGRMAIGPAIGIYALIVEDFRAMWSGDPRIRLAWGLHLFGLAMVLGWLAWIGEMPIWAYALCAYFGFSLLKIRTFLEHRAHDLARARTVVIEDRGPLALLFLNNNYHTVHHAHPGVAWYRLPALYFTNRAQFLRRNDGYVYRSYAEIFRKFLLHAKDPVPHPNLPVNKTD